MNLGYIGLGHMGIPCVRNLLRAGHSVRIWSRRPAVAAPLVQEGARLSNDIASLATDVDILILNVRNTGDVESILLGEGGVAENGKKGLLVIDMTSTSYTATRRLGQILAERGIELVDAPVTGDSKCAEDKTLTFMVGAKKATFDRVKPLLLDMGSKVSLVGPGGAGQVTQGCNHILLSATLSALGEALKFASEGGVDFEPIREALSEGNTMSPLLEQYFSRVVKENFEAGFTTDLHYKAMAQVMSLANEVGFALPFSQKITALLEKAVERGYGEQDSSIVAKLMAETGTKNPEDIT